MNLRWSFGLVFGDYVRRFMDPFETASQSGENMEEQFSCTVCLTLYRCLAVVQYEQIGILGKRSDRSLSRAVQYGESGEIFHEGICKCRIFGS